jgi:hypothetical protein
MQTAAAYTMPLVFHSHRRAPSMSLFGGASDEYRELEAQLEGAFFKLSLQCVCSAPPIILAYSLTHH